MKDLNGFQEIEVSDGMRSMPMVGPRAAKCMSCWVPPPALLPRAIVSVVMLALMLIMGIGFISQAYAQLSPGDVLVINSNGGTDDRGALFRVNAANGSRTVVSDFGNNAQGPLGSSPTEVIMEASGNILVIDITAGTTGDGALFRVNPTTGNRTLVSDFGDINQGPLGSAPNGVALDSLGDILVTDNSVDALFMVDTANGNRTILSDFSNNTQGTLGVTPIEVALDASGNILVIDGDAGTNGIGVLFRVNPANGNRTVVSDFSNGIQGPLGENPAGVAIVPPQPRLGDILVIDPEAGVNGFGALFAVDIFNGSRSLISNFGMSAQGRYGSARPKDKRTIA